VVTVDIPYTPLCVSRISGDTRFLRLRAQLYYRIFFIGSDLKKHGRRIDPPVVLEPVDVCRRAMASCRCAEEGAWFVRHVYNKREFFIAPSADVRISSGAYFFIELMTGFRSFFPDFSQYKRLLKKGYRFFWLFVFHSLSGDKNRPKETERQDYGC
jgi:hypothetical protein